MRRRGLWIALIASLAVNLFVIGGLGGAALMGVRVTHKSKHGAAHSRMAALADSLPPAQRQPWLNTLGRALEDSRPKLAEARAARRDAWNMLRADRIDPQAAMAALNRSRQLEIQARSEMDRAVVAFVATLPKRDRERLIEALKQAKLQRSGRSRSRSPDPDIRSLTDR